MPHHVRQQVHHNINQDAGTENIDRGHPSMADPEVAAQLTEESDGRENRRGVKGSEKPPRGTPEKIEV